MQPRYIIMGYLLSILQFNYYNKVGLLIILYILCVLLTLLLADGTKRHAVIVHRNKDRSISRFRMQSYCTALRAGRVNHVLKCSRTGTLQDYYDCFAQGTAALYLCQNPLLLYEADGRPDSKVKVLYFRLSIHMIENNKIKLLYSELE